MVARPVDGYRKDNHEEMESACGAYDEAVKRRPGKLITLRQKARLIKKSR